MEALTTFNLALCLCFRTPTSTHLLALPITMKDAKELRQIARDWIHRTGSGADAASDNKESTSRVTDLAIDSLSVALELAGKVADIFKEAPLIAPVGALLSQILKLYDDMKTTKDKKDILAAHITGLSGDVCATVLQIETTKQSDLIQRLKTDLKTYADLIFKASDIVRKYDNQGTLSHVATHKQLGGKIDKINQELTSFGTRFRNNPGAGKSVLCSAVISQLLADEKLFQVAENQRRPPAMAYFFFDFRNLETRSVEIALRGIILQLSAQCPDAYKCLDTHYAAGRTLPGYKDLLVIIPELLRQLGRTHIIIDALDECDTDDHDHLVELMSTFRQWNETQLHVLFTSQTREIFTAGFDGVPHIALKHNCLLTEVSRCKYRTELDITLKCLPSTLFGAYDRFLAAVPEKHQSHGHSSMLADAISFDFSDPDQYTHEPDRRESNASAIFDWLEGLVTKSTGREDSVFVVLAHASVQEYTTSTHFHDKFHYSLTWRRCEEARESRVKARSQPRL
ncbi:hypothetical protein DFH09DRAFT_1427171 [Mycena vulgaris]|nr:hypothetical protein DFH09DRAFT_1427171 [Mycena vulgaris]